MLPDMRPDFGKNFFEKYQSKLVRLANSWIGRRFFDFKGGFGLGKIRVMALYPNAVSYDWKVKDGQLVKTTCFSTDNHYQKKLEHAYRFVKMFVPQAVAWKMLQPSGALSLLPMVALTTSTFYPDANPESTSVDGHVGDAGVDMAWASKRAAAGTSKDDSSATMYLARFRSSTTSGQWSQLYRGIFLFDTSSIGDLDTIDSAVFSAYITIIYNGFSSLSGLRLNCYSSAPASNTALANGDFDSLGTTEFSTSKTYASLSTSAYNNWTLNASGIDAISLTSVTKLGTREAYYDASGNTPTWESFKDMDINCYQADNGSNKPKLVVEHSAPGPANLKSLNAVAKANIKSVNGVALANIKSING